MASYWSTAGLAQRSGSVFWWRTTWFVTMMCWWCAYLKSCQHWWWCDDLLPATTWSELFCKLQKQLTCCRLSSSVVHHSVYNYSWWVWLPKTYTCYVNRCISACVTFDVVILLCVCSLMAVSMSRICTIFDKCRYCVWASNEV